MSWKEGMGVPRYHPVDQCKSRAPILLTGVSVMSHYKPSKICPTEMYDEKISVSVTTIQLLLD